MLTKETYFKVTLGNNYSILHRIHSQYYIIYLDTNDTYRANPAHLDRKVIEMYKNNNRFTMTELTPEEAFLEIL
jgi:hypothetical protein